MQHRSVSQDIRKQSPNYKMKIIKQINPFPSLCQFFLYNLQIPASRVIEINGTCGTRLPTYMYTTQPKLIMGINLLNNYLHNVLSILLVITLIMIISVILVLYCPSTRFHPCYCFPTRFYSIDFNNINQKQTLLSPK